MMETAHHNMSRRGFVAGSVAAALAAAFGVGAARAEEPKSAADATPATDGVVLHRGYTACHGGKSFTQVVVAVDPEGKIVAANIDEYQFMSADAEGLVPVPNAELTGEGELGSFFAEGVALASKADNDELYSAAMKEKGGATQTWLTSIKAIEEFAAGKTTEELTGVDTVSGATLADTANYVAAIAQVAQDDTIVSAGGEAGADAKLVRFNGVAHTKKGFADAVVLVSDGTIVASSIDEFMMKDAIDGIVPVPRTDDKFGANLPEGSWLISKAVNDEAYSAGMIEKAGSTMTWADSIAIIDNGLVGAKADGSDFDVDAISGATLADTAAYAQVALDAAALASKQK